MKHEDGTPFSVDLVPNFVCEGGLTKMQVRNTIMKHLTTKTPPCGFKYLLKYLTEDGTLINEFNSEEIKKVNVLMKLVNYQGAIILKPVLNEFISKSLKHPSVKKVYIFMKLLKQAMPESGVKSYTLKKVMYSLWKSDPSIGSDVCQVIRAALNTVELKGKFHQYTWSQDVALIDWEDFPHSTLLPDKVMLHCLSKEANELHDLCNKRKSTKEELKKFTPATNIAGWTKGGNTFLHQAVLSRNISMNH